MGSSGLYAQDKLEAEKETATKLIDKPRDGFVNYGVVLFGKTGETKIPLDD